MCLVCGLSQRGAVREHGDKLSHLGGLQLGRAEDSTRSVGEGIAAVPTRPSLASVLLSVFLQAVSVAVRALAEKGSRPPAEVEDMVPKTHTDDPFWKFRDRPQEKVAISACCWPRNPSDIAERLYRRRRTATLLFILLSLILGINRLIFGGVVLFSLPLLKAGNLSKARTSNKKHEHT